MNIIVMLILFWVFYFTLPPLIVAICSAIEYILKLASKIWLKTPKKIMTPEEEKTNMQFAAIMTASIQNTDRTVLDRIDRSNAYWTVAYDDVCKAVDREIKHRKNFETVRSALLKMVDVETVEEIKAMYDAVLKLPESEDRTMAIVGIEALIKTI